MLPPSELLRAMFDAAVDAVAPARCVPRHLPEVPRGRTLVIGAGKAAAAMARAVEEHWRGELEGLVVTRYDHGVECARIEVIEAAHPVPDAAGRAAAGRMLEAVGGLSEDDLVLCLLSGGGSALLAWPPPWLDLDQKRDVNAQLLRSGASIAEMNCVRKHLSAIKGGRLGVACAPARVVTLMISDVPGDDPSVIASGPTVADPTTCAEAVGVLRKYSVEVPAPVLAAMRDHESPKPGDPMLARCEHAIIATAADALAAAATVGEDHGVRVVQLGDHLEGEARELAAEHAALAAGDHERPVVLLSGGETTVTVRGSGRGGRNAEYSLALAVALDGRDDVHAIACDTDGIDGTEANAGCMVSPDTLARARALGLDARAHLADNDAYSFFSALGDTVVTGPTRTNVNDFRAILVS